jgi:hypothetical protein
MKNILTMLGLLSVTVIVGTSQAPSDTKGIASDEVLARQLQVVEARKGEPLTITDTVRAVVSQFAVTLDMAGRQQEQHAEAAESLIKTLDSTIQAKQSTHVPSK